MDRKVYKESDVQGRNFADFYLDVVLPIQEDIEEQRKDHIFALKQKIAILVFSIIWGIVSSLIGLHKMQTPILLLYLVIALFFCALGLLIAYENLAYRSSTKQKVFKRIVEFLNKFAYVEYRKMTPLEFSTSRILPKYKSFMSEGQIMGKHKDFTVNIAEMKLYKPMIIKPILDLIFGLLTICIKLLWLMWLGILSVFMLFQLSVDSSSGESRSVRERQKEMYNSIKDHFLDRVVFRGSFIEIQMPISFKGTTIGIRDKGIFGNYVRSFKIHNMKNVKVKSHELENIFEFYSNSKDETTRLIKKDFLEKLVELNKIVNNSHKRGLSFSFFGDKCLIMIPCKAIPFEPRFLFKTAIRKEDARIFFKEIHILFEIIEILKDNLGIETMRATI